jgi:HEAT repeat protein
LGLMNDPDARVRRAAINAAGVLRSPEFVIPLIYRTQSIETLHEAVDALTLFGNAIIPTLAKVLGNHLEDPHIRRAVARVLGRLATTESVNVITHHLGEPDEELRARMYKSLARAVRGRRMALSDPKPVNDALMRELERAFETLHQAELLGLGNGPGPDTPLRGEPAARALLASALAEKVAQAERRIFLLLAVLYPDADMEQIYAGIHDATALDAPRRRANATELLDNLLARNVKRRFLPLLEELPRAKKLELVAEMYAPRPRDARAVLTELARDETAWVRACAVWCLSQLEPTQGAADLAELLASSTADQNPVVRESALVALSRAAPMRAREIAESRLRDEAPVVRRQAAIITTTMLQHEGAVH